MPRATPLQWLRRAILACAVALVASPPLAADQPRSDTSDPKPLRIQLKWLHQFQFAGYYAALERGYYEEAGLDVELIEGQPGVDPLTEVLAGRADFGVGTPELLISYADGAPIVVLGVIFQHSPYIFLSTQASGIQTINDLAGKRVMIEPQSAELYAYLEREQIPLDILTILPHTFTPQALIEGSVDAMSAYSTDEPFTLTAQGIPFYSFSPRSAGIDFYGDCFFTSQKYLREHPNCVRAFREATIRGWRYAMANPEEIVDLILRDYPTIKSREALLYEAMRMSNLIYPELIPIGYMYEGRWQHILQTYQSLGMIAPDTLDLGPFLYDPNPKPNYTWAIWLLTTAFACLIIILGILLPLWRFNIRLRREIEVRKQAEVHLTKAKEEAERADHAKTEFIASVTHDLRTPLNAILGTANLLIEDLKGSQYQANLKAIQSSGESLLQLVNDLLDLNQLDSGKITLRDKPFLIDEALDPVAELLASAAQRKGLEFAWWIEPELPGGLRCDPDRLRQIIFNLGGNAIKFTELGHITLTVGLNPKGWLRITLSDTGPGIPEEIKDRLFEPFVRASNTQGKEGSGLGLSIVRRLAQSMGGTVSIRSTEGVGTTCTLDIPVRDDTATGDHYPNFKQKLTGLPLSVFLHTPLRTHAAARNLQSLGAQVTEGDSPIPPTESHWHLIDEDSPALKGQSRENLIFLPREGRLLTRSLLARAILKHQRT